MPAQAKPSLFDLALGKAQSLLSPAAVRYGAPSCINRGRLARLHAVSSFEDDDRTRMELAAFQHEMFRGNQLQFIEPHPGESDIEFSQRPHLRTLNLTRVVIDILSGLYRAPVERKLSGGDKAWRDLLEVAWRVNAVDTLLASVDRAVRLQGTCAVQPVWREGKPEFRILPAHRFAVLRDPTQPCEPLAVVVLPAPRALDGLAPEFADIWTAQEFARVSQGRVTERHAHGYTRLPFAIFRDRAPLDEFWTEGRGRSLCHDNAVLNARLSDLAQVLALQGFGVMEVVNPDPSQDVRLGPGRAIAFRTGGDIPFGVNFKNPGAPIAELSAELAEHIRHILLAQRIPESAISVSMTSSASGVAIVAAGSPVLEDRAERARSFAAAESRLFEATVSVAARHANLRAADAPEFAVNYPEPELAANLALRDAAA